MIIVTAAVFSFFASARSLQIGDGVAVIAVTSVAANLSTIVAGLAVFGDRLGHDALVVGVRLAAFALLLLGAALIPAPVRAGKALMESESASPARARLQAHPDGPNRDRECRNDAPTGCCFAGQATGPAANVGAIIGLAVAVEPLRTAPNRRAARMALKPA